MQSPLRILSLDGGGVRGISTLYILKELMAQISRQHRAEHPQSPRIYPQPCDYFDLICGTSTGGLIALMLGRLRMSVDDAIEKYKTLSRNVFTSKSKDRTTTFDHNVLEQEIKKAIAASGTEASPDAELKDPLSDSELCHTFVVSTSLRSAGGAVRMRTYDTLTADAFPARIWEVARATSAAPTFFAPIYIDGVSYGDGGTGWNNPTKEAIAEVQNIWPNRPIACVVSIGTGLEEALQLNDKSQKLPEFIDGILRKTSPKLAFAVAVAEYCVRCLTSCEITHRELAENPERIVLDGNYFRLNVPQGMSRVGLDEWDKLGDIIALTNSYMTHGEIMKPKQIIAKLLQTPQLALVKSNYLPIFNVPYPRDSLLTGQAAFIEDQPLVNQATLGSHTVNKLILYLRNAPEPSIHFVERLSVSVDKVCGKLIKHPRIIISGLPGVGKTELVRQVIKKVIKEKKYKGIFWLSAATEKIFQAEIYALARALDLPEDPNMNIEMARESMLEELNRRNNWLMVLDNVDDRTLVKGFLPDQGDTRHVLITSRYGGANLMNGHVIRLEIMSVSEASMLFANMYHDDELEHHSQDSLAVAQLVTELGYLPLAIVQAVAYLYETQEDISNYIRIYKETRKSIWDFKPAEGDYISVAAVMALSFKKIKASEETVRLFCLIAFFAPDNIPELLLTSDAIFKDNVLRSVFQNKGDLNRVIGPLCAYSFIKRLPAQHSFSIHRVVQDVMRDIIEGQIMDEANILETFSRSEASPNYWITRSVESMVSAYPDSINSDNWEICEKYDIRTNEMCSLYLSIGTYEWSHGNYQSGESLYLNALSISEQLCGPDHITTGGAIHNLGLVYNSQGKYDEAIAQSERALRIYEKAFGVDYINTAGIINNLGSTYSRQGKYDEAIAQYERALRIYEKAFGVDHINTADTIMNIGLFYKSRNQVDLAKLSLRRGYEIFLKNLGEFHPNTQKAAAIMSSMGCEQGDTIERTVVKSKSSWKSKLKKLFS